MSGEGVLLAVSAAGGAAARVHGAQPPAVGGGSAAAAPAPPAQPRAYGRRLQRPRANRPTSRLGLLRQRIVILFFAMLKSSLLNTGFFSVKINFCGSVTTDKKSSACFSSVLNPSCEKIFKMGHQVIRKNF